jgi:hypothetical protein
MDYSAKARHEIADAVERDVVNRAAGLQQHDERAATLAALRTKWGLPADATPRAIADAERRQEAIAKSYLSQSGSAKTIATMRALAAEIGMQPAEYDPDNVGGASWPAIWAKLRDTDHRFIRIRRSPDGVGFIVPAAIPAPQPPSAGTTLH